MPSAAAEKSAANYPILASGCRAHPSTISFDQTIGSGWWAIFD